MTVAELIKQLQAYPQALEVIVDSYEEGFDPVTDVKQQAIEKITDKSWYEGVYDEAKNSNHQAVLIRSRYNRMDTESEK